MRVLEQHQTPDSLLTFKVIQLDGGEISLGFDGYPSHTHADILARLSGLDENSAVRAYVDDLLEGRAMIAISRTSNEIRDVWITDDPTPDKWKPEDETIEFRYWDGRAIV